jgi:type II secretory pathway pseudopilin PulG
LIELIIVIAIIGILMSLLLTAIMSLTSKGQVAMTANEITNLSAAMETFHARFKRYPPSSLFLSNNYADYAPTDPSLAWLNAAFPNLGTYWPLNPTAIDWTGGAGGMPVGGVTLTADQCLVFALGGIPTPDGVGVNGFSTNTSNPTQATGDRIPPFFNFQSNRLVKRVTGNPFFSYVDPWNRNQPYLFFSSGNRMNGYNDADATLGVAPYYEAVNPKRYLNPSSFQIISAGQNGLFGAGGLWTPSTCDVVYPWDSPGFDDQSNFHDGKTLGIR